LSLSRSCFSSTLGHARFPDCPIFAREPGFMPGFFYV